MLKYFCRCDRSKYGLTPPDRTQQTSQMNVETIQDKNNNSNINAMKTF